MSENTPTEREAIARIIDPDAWANLGWRKRQGFDTSRDTARSLRKADAILALRGEGEPVAWQTKFNGTWSCTDYPDHYRSQGAKVRALYLRPSPPTVAPEVVEALTDLIGGPHHRLGGEDNAEAKDAAPLSIAINFGKLRRARRALLQAVEGIKTNG